MTPQDPMDDIDHGIDRALQALAHADPHPHLEDRILQALAYRSPIARRPLFFTSTSVLSTGTGRLLLATATILFALLLTLHQPHLSHLNPSSLAPQHQPPSQPIPHPAPTDARQFSSTLNPSSLALQHPPSSSLTSDLALTNPSQPSSSLNGSKLPAQHGPGAPSMTASSSWVGSPPPIHLEVTLVASPPRTSDAQALADLQTPSFPAPPLPPTAQERLVRLMLRRGEKQDLAQLDPYVQATSAQEERAELQIFFDPPHPAVQAETERLDRMLKQPSSASEAPGPIVSQGQPTSRPPSEPQH